MQMLGCSILLAVWCAAPQKAPQRLPGELHFVEPVAVAGVEWIDGRLVQTTEWIPYGGAAQHCADTPVYNCFEPCPLPVPECNYDQRWYFGAAYCSGGSINDMAVAPGSEGAQSKEVMLAWYWNGGPGPAGDAIIVVLTGEQDWTEASCLSGIMPFYSGVAYHFGILNAGAYVASPVLCGTALYHQMPVDGNGVHAILFRTEDLEQVAPCAQMFLWGTGEDDSPPDGRAGTQHRLQYDDDFPKDGSFHPVDECYDYTYGLVPDPLGPMILFYAEMTPPCAPCDLDCDGSINAFDIEPFAGRLSGDNGCSACAGDANADGSVNGFDIQGFVECLGG